MSNQYSLINAQVPEGTCFTDVQSLFDLIAEYVTVQTDPNASFVIISATTPGADDRDKIWFRVDSSGRPLGCYLFYNGAWRKIWDEPVGAIKFWSGDTSEFDATGLGNVGGQWDGWAICNGNNSTPDLRDQFIIVANQYSGGSWQTNVTGSLTQDGGSKDVTMQVANLPAHTHQVTNHTNPGGGGNCNGADFTACGVSNKVDITSSTGSGDSFEVLPPYYSLCALQYIGYT